MQTIFFPITYIPETLLNAARTCFLHVIAYQPTCTNIPFYMQDCAERGLLDICSPINHGDEEIQAALIDHRSRASLHRDGLLDYFKAQRDSVPFFDETSPAQIKAEVFKKGQKKGPNPLFYSRLFLQIAQEYDIKAEEISRELVSAELSEQDLIKNLVGGPTASVNKISGLNSRVHNDSAEYMVAERVIAWARLFQQYPEIGTGDRPRLFITNSRIALEVLLNQPVSSEIVLNIESIPVQTADSLEFEKWRNRLNTTLDSLARNSGTISWDDVANIPVAGEVRCKFSLSLYRVNESPVVLFNRCLETGKTREGVVGIKPKKPVLTLLGLICVQ